MSAHTPYRHAVVGIDLDPEGGNITAGSAAAIAVVRWLAGGGRKLRCTLLHAVETGEFWHPGEQAYAVGARPDPDVALDAARRELEAGGIEVDVVRAEEHAWLAITRCVVQGPADLVIVGKRSEADWDGPLIGSQAAKLLRKCPSAVWVVRPGDVPPPRCVLAATDLSPVGEKVIERAAQIAQGGSAALHAVHAFQFTMAAQLEKSETGPEYVERVARDASAKIREGVRAAGFEGKPELHVGLTSPTRAILECVRRYQPDLVVMGTVSRGGVAGLLLGNTAERLLPRLEPSLLTLKPADFVCPVAFD